MYEANRSTLARWVLSSDATCALPNPRVGFHRPWAQLVDNCRLASIGARHLCATQVAKAWRTARTPIHTSSIRPLKCDRDHEPMSTGMSGSQDAVSRTVAASRSSVQLTTVLLTNTRLAEVAVCSLPKGRPISPSPGFVRASPGEAGAVLSLRHSRRAGEREGLRRCLRRGGFRFCSSPAPFWPGRPRMKFPCMIHRCPWPRRASSRAYRPYRVS